VLGSRPPARPVRWRREREGAVGGRGGMGSAPFQLTDRRRRGGLPRLGGNGARQWIGCGPCRGGRWTGPCGEPDGASRRQCSTAMRGAQGERCCQRGGSPQAYQAADAAAVSMSAGRRRSGGVRGVDGGRCLSELCSTDSKHRPSCFVLFRIASASGQIYPCILLIYRRPNLHLPSRSRHQRRTHYRRCIYTPSCADPAQQFSQNLLGW
jgi:hypothetical protein